MLSRRGRNGHPCDRLPRSGGVRLVHPAQAAIEATSEDSLHDGELRALPAIAFRREGSALFGQHDERDMDVRCAADRQTRLHRRLVETPKDGHELLGLRWIGILEVIAHERPEDADRRAGRLEPGDDLAVGDPWLALRAAAGERRAVARRLEVVVETVLGMFARTDLLEQFAIKDLEAERDAVDADFAEAVVTLEVTVWRCLDADQQAELLFDAKDVWFEDVEVGVAVVVARRAARVTAITSSTDFSSASSTPRLRPTEQNLQFTLVGFWVQYSQTFAW